MFVYKFPYDKSRSRETDLMIYSKDKKVDPPITFGFGRTALSEIKQKKATNVTNGALNHVLKLSPFPFGYFKVELVFLIAYTLLLLDFNSKNITTRP